MTTSTTGWQHNHIDHTLSRALHFDEHDLQCNRQGRISMEQRNRMHLRRLRNCAGLVMLTIAAGLLAALIWTDTQNLLCSKLSTSGLSGMVALGAAIFAAYYWQKIQTDLDSGTVHDVTGRVQLANKHVRPGRLGAIIIEGQQFNVPNKILQSFRDGEWYTLYYAPHSTTLLAAEPAGQPQDDQE